jgi:hypothetical protein
MKYMRSLYCASALAAVGLVVGLIAGCNQNQSSSASQFKPVEKTSFNEVTSQLDPGGDLYLYLGTAQWLDGLSTKIGVWKTGFSSIPDMNAHDVSNINNAFDIVTRLVKDSGIEEVSGVGLSSVKIEKDMYRNKMLIHHYPGKGNGFLWKLSGKEPHTLNGLDMLPSDTAIAIFSDLDLPLVWTNVEKEVSQSQIPEAQDFINKLPTEFEQKTGVKWNDLLHSLGGEFGFVMTLNPSNNVVLPIPEMVVQIPDPKILIAIKVNDDTIFNRIDTELKSNQQVISINKTDLKMRTMPVPLPLPIALRPTAASSGGYLLIASSDSLINEVIAVKTGKSPGLKSTDEFKHLSKNIPEKGNQFTFVSQRFADTLLHVQHQMLAKAGDKGAKTEWLQSLMTNQPSFAYSVSANTSEGVLMVANSSQSQATSALLLPTVAASGAIAAIAIPNFVKARTTSKQNACINNLRKIDAAKQQWALENHKKESDTPKKEELTPYLHDSWPTCPDGGTYTLNAINQAPECSISGHQLQ